MIRKIQNSRVFISQLPKDAGNVRERKVPFSQPGTKTISLRFAAPSPAPDRITVILRANGGELRSSRLSCQ